MLTIIGIWDAVNSHKGHWRSAILLFTYAHLFFVLVYSKGGECLSLSRHSFFTLPLTGVLGMSYSHVASIEAGIDLALAWLYQKFSRICTENTTEPYPWARSVSIQWDKTCLCCHQYDVWSTWLDARRKMQ